MRGSMTRMLDLSATRFGRAGASGRRRAHATMATAAFPAEAKSLKCEGGDSRRSMPAGAGHGGIDAVAMSAKDSPRWLPRVCWYLPPDCWRRDADVLRFRRRFMRAILLSLLGAAVMAWLLMVAQSTHVPGRPILLFRRHYYLQAIGELIRAGALKRGGDAGLSGSST